MGTIWAIARAIGKKYCTRLLLLIRQVRVSLCPKGGLKEGTKTRRRIFLAKRHSQGKCPNGSSKLCQFLLSPKNSYAKSGYVSMEDISPTKYRFLYQKTPTVALAHIIVIVDHHHSRLIVVVFIAVNAAVVLVFFSSLLWMKKSECTRLDACQGYSLPRNRQ